MSLKCVGLVPLVLVFGVVLTFAQSVDHNCRDPILPDGYFLPLESEASAQAVITYACERGHKPAAQGWWATSRCQGNAWIPEPRCIDEKACLPPTVPNSEQPKDPQRWYENGHVIWVTCEKGYEHKDRKTTAKCENGSWSTLPVCERDPDSCGAPPQVPHAIIVGHDYQKVYPSDSHVTYQCEDGFTSMQSDSATKVFCIAGSWSETPVCKRPVVDPETDGKVTEPEVRECGNPPSIENGYYVGQDKMTLTYECHAPYTLDGPNTVVCSNNGLWSELPTCKARSDCQIRPGRYHDGLEILQEILLNDGHGLTTRCYSNLYRIVRCDNRKITYTSCCGDWYFQHNYCPARFTPY